MVTAQLVLIDTCAWIPFFDRRPSSEKQAVTELLEANRGVLIGPVMTELLRGFRRQEEADWVASYLRGVQFLELIWDDWRQAAKLGRELSSRGHKLPLTDLVLAVAALRRQHAVLTTDPHFDSMPGLTRYTRG